MHIEPSRPVPTPIEGVISSEEVLLLQYGYSGEWPGGLWSMTALFRMLATEYGASISSAPLRHAMLAFCAERLPRPHFVVVEHHTQQVRHYLMERLRTPDVICDADFFATWLLSYGTSFYNQTSEWFYHARGTMAIANHLSKTRKGKRMSNLMVLMDPYLRLISNATYIYGRLEHSDVACLGIPCPAPKLNQSFQAMKQLMDFYMTTAPVSSTNFGDSTLYTLLALSAQAVDIAFECLFHIAFSEAGVRCDLKSLIDEVVDYICDEDWAAITTKFGIVTSDAPPPNSRTLLVIQLERILGLEMQILNCRSFWPFVHSNSASIADLILNTYRTHVTLLPDLREWCLIVYPQSLVLAGLNLSVDGVGKRIRLSLQSLTS
jgi:hypothetical protein